MNDRAEDTRVWMAVFLAVALTMIIGSLGWAAFGPPIT
jgi:hypothetical protein